MNNWSSVIQNVSRVSFRRALLVVPPSFFAIPVGLAGLAGVWRYAAKLYALPTAIGEALFLLAGVVFLLLALAVLTKLAFAPHTIADDLTNPLASPFTALVSIGGMLLSLGLAPYAQALATTLFLIFFAAMWLLGGWLSGQWIIGKLDADSVHPGYFLPTVAGGLVAANGAATFGFTALAWMSFGLGIVCWLIIGAVVTNRLLTRPSLPVALVPTLAVQLAPPAVAGNAYFALQDNRLDMMAYFLAGYVVLMLLVQVRLLPLYRRTPFAPSYWSFTFPFASTAIYALHWLNLLQPVGARIYGYGIIVAVTLLIGGIAVRSLIELGRGTFLPPTAKSKP